MKKQWIILIVVLLLLVVIIIIAIDLRSTRTANRSVNKFALDISEQIKVDPSLIGYKEVRDYNIEAKSPGGIAIRNQKIYMVADNFLQVFNTEGNQLFKVTLPYEARCLDVSKQEEIVIGFGNRVGYFNGKGDLLWISDTLNSRAFITAVATKDDLIFAADAGNRVVHRYDISGKYLDNFEGGEDGGDMPGFIVPSGYFDLKISNDGELWIVNPGKHAFDNYTDEGDLRGYWANGSTDINGFSGCCNPAHIAFLSNGSLVTSEKLIVRIKVHKPSGELVTVVAAPDEFKENGVAPDIAVDDKDNIYALDYDRKTIRVFAPK